MNRPRSCPWVTKPSHGKNGRIMVDKWTPVSFGYCGTDPTCASCAGTGLKPNVLLNVGRPSDTVACPYCDPERYRKELTKMGKWTPPPPPPAPGQPEAEADTDWDDWLDSEEGDEEDW